MAGKGRVCSEFAQRRSFGLYSCKQRGGFSKCVLVDLQRRKTLPACEFGYLRNMFYRWPDAGLEVVPRRLVFGIEIGAQHTLRQRQRFRFPCREVVCNRFDFGSLGVAAYSWHRHVGRHVWEFPYGLREIVRRFGILRLGFLALRLQLLSELGRNALRLGSRFPRRYRILENGCLPSHARKARCAYTV